MIKSGNYDPSKSTSWKVVETVLSHLNRPARSIFLMLFSKAVKVWIVVSDSDSRFHSFGAR